MKEKNQGITLIALIITIIIMLILVAVSIQIAIQSGLFKAAGKAAQETNMAKDAERELASGKVNIGGSTYNSIDEYLTTLTPLPEGAGKKVPEDTIYTYNSDGKTAKIPGGFTVSGKRSETSIDNGLVIYLIDDKTDEQIASINWEDETTVANLQATYDQFVWIPIPRENINNMYICQAKTASNGTCNITVNSDGKAECQTHKTIDSTKATKMAGRLYATTYGEKFEQGYTEVYTTGSGLREPDTALGRDNNTDNLTQLNTILGTSFAPTTDTENNNVTANTDFKTYLQEEYNDIVKSVYENQGFYIGRYETSGMVNTNTNPTIKVVAGSNNTTNANISNVTWYRMYAQQKKYASNKGLTSVKSAMIQGAAYDQVMKFVENGTRPDGEPYTIKTVGHVAHTSSQNITGVYQTGGINYPSAATVPYNDCVKNIYDLEGNVRAWTTEANSNSIRVSRRWSLR